MNSEKPKNLIIPEEVMGAYKSWLEEFREGRRAMPYEKIPPLFFMATCQLWIEDACNNLNCARCPAAKETFRWARQEIEKDGIVSRRQPSGPAYSQNPGSGSTSMFAVIETTRDFHTIKLEVKEEDREGRIMIVVN